MIYISYLSRKDSHSTRPNDLGLVNRWDLEPDYAMSSSHTRKEKDHAQTDLHPLTHRASLDEHATFRSFADQLLSASEYARKGKKHGVGSNGGWNSPASSRRLISIIIFGSSREGTRASSEHSSLEAQRAPESRAARGPDSAPIASVERRTRLRALGPISAASD